MDEPHRRSKKSARPLTRDGTQTQAPLRGHQALLNKELLDLRAIGALLPAPCGLAILPADMAARN
jgi:hypothetical protein